MDQVEAINQTTAESPYESRLSALLRDSKTLRSRLRAERQEKKAQNHPSLILARKSLRNAYLKLLFNFPFSSRSRGVDSEIWSETSHPGVHVYRSILSQLEKQMKEAQMGTSPASSRQDGATNGDTKQSSQKQLAQLAQKYIRIAATFRGYLAEEEMFWRELVGRIVRVFNVEEAKPNLRLLGIVCDRAVAQELNDDTLSTVLDRITGADAEGGDLELQAKLPANAARLIEIIYKGLLCCGDLARYQELYKEDKRDEPLGKPKHHQRGGKRGGRGGGHMMRSNVPPFSDNKDTGKDYTVARQCYEQARAIFPSNGQASNAIAVLATYKVEPFAAVYHYYRALCVVTPFEPAKQNLESMLKRAVDKWRAQGEVLPAAEPWEDLEKQRSNLLQSLVILHGHFFLPSESALPPLFEQHCHQFIASLLSGKALTADTIVQIVATAIASLWTRRLWRGKEEGGAATNTGSEQRILLHLVGLFKVLVEVGASETRDAIELAKTQPPSDPSGTNQATLVARNITAVFRRMLPALRIASKWLKSHVEYIERSREPSVANASLETEAVNEAIAKQRSELSAAVAELWSKYVNFINVIRFAFPFNRLPNLGNSGQSGMTSLNFEEDRDMRGFVPMKKAMLVDAKRNVKEAGNSRGAEENQLHPNEEHLIRIADLLIDAKVIAESHSSPIAFDDDKNHFYLATTEAAEKSQTESSLAKSSAVVVPESVDQTFNRSEDSKWENGSESTEDAVDLAMRAVDERRRAFGTNGTLEGEDSDEEDDDDDDDDGEIILIPSGTINLSAKSEVSTASPSGSSSAQMLSMPAAAAATSATTVTDRPAEEPLTAQHLLLQMINGNRGASRPGTIGSIPSPSPSPSTPQPHLLFGGITSSASRASFGSVANHGGAWDGNEALHFMNQQQNQQQRPYASAYPSFGSSTPWGPPSRDQSAGDWR